MALLILYEPLLHPSPLPSHRSKPIFPTTLVTAPSRLMSCGLGHIGHPRKADVVSNESLANLLK
ncbi:hypothetical protein, partial [Streptomyces malaysiense]|uniref:hypothetical protein n=1 Tax=Streptomyces malaysiense TaxID=1428626 RepID=UPI0019D04A31